MECLKTLHWLPIKYRINYKVCTLVFKCLHAMAPPYLIKLIKIKQQRRQGLRSGNINNILEVPKTKRKTFASQAFSVYVYMDHKHGMHYQTPCEQQMTMIGSAKTTRHTFPCKHTNKLLIVKCPHNGNISWCTI